MKIDVSDMYWDEDTQTIDFCGDSFYGSWTIDDFAAFIEALKERLEEIKNGFIK